MRGVGPLTITAFFTNLKDMWLERNPYVSTQLPIELSKAPIGQLVLSTPASQKDDDFKVRLARDLAYNGIAMDDETLENFIYEELQKRLGARTAHIRKSPFKESV